MIHEILKMGDPRLLRVAKPVERFDTPELHQLVADMFETMKAANGALADLWTGKASARDTAQKTATVVNGILAQPMAT